MIDWRWLLVWIAGLTAVCVVSELLRWRRVWQIERKVSMLDARCGVHRSELDVNVIESTEHRTAIGDQRLALTGLREQGDEQRKQLDGLTEQIDRVERWIGAIGRGGHGGTSKAEVVEVDGLQLTREYDVGCKSCGAHTFEPHTPECSAYSYDEDHASPEVVEIRDPPACAGQAEGHNFVNGGSFYTCTRCHVEADDLGRVVLQRTAQPAVNAPRCTAVDTFSGGRRVRCTLAAGDPEHVHEGPGGERWQSKAVAS
jgi:hypothetical protein